MINFVQDFQDVLNSSVKNIISPFQNLNQAVTNNQFLQQNQPFENQVEQLYSNPFEAPQEEPEGETIYSVNEEDTKEIADKTKVILNPDKYSVEDYEKATEEIELLSECEYDLKQEEVAEYATLVNELDEYIKSEGDTSIVEDDLLNLVRDVNIENGVSPVVANAIRLAYDEIGVTEDGTQDNYGEDIKKYGGAQGDPWCTSFISYLYGSAQGINFKETFSRWGSDIAVRFIRSEAQSKNAYMPKEQYEPAPGDVMVLENNGASHVGLVVGNDEKYIYTIEGNADDAVRAKKYDKTMTENNKYADVSGYINMGKIYGSKMVANNADFMSQDDFELAHEQVKTI